MTKILASVATLLAVTACGTDQAALTEAAKASQPVATNMEPSTEKTKTKASPAAETVATEEPTAMALKTRQALPQCESVKHGALAYILDEGIFVVCDAELVADTAKDKIAVGEWKTIDLRGRDGVAGKDAVSIAGRDGVDGITTTVVQTVTNTVVTPASSKLTDSTGQDLGYFVGYSPDTVYMRSQHGTYRISWRYGVGTVPADQIKMAYTLYSGANCTGSVRMLVENGQWENVAREGETGALLHATGSMTGGQVAYASRRAYGGACANTSGTAYRTYATENVTANFPIVLPAVDIQIIND